MSASADGRADHPRFESYAVEASEARPLRKRKRLTTTTKTAAHGELTPVPSSNVADIPSPFKAHTSDSSTAVETARQIWLRERYAEMIDEDLTWG